MGFKANLRVILRMIMKIPTVSYKMAIKDSNKIKVENPVTNPFTGPIDR